MGPEHHGRVETSQDHERAAECLHGGMVGSFMQQSHAAVDRRVSKKAYWFIPVRYLSDGTVDRP